MDRVVVQMDLFPSRVTIQSTTYEQVRAVIADGRLQIFRLTSGGVASVYDKDSLGVAGQISTGVEVETEDGIIWIELGEGCACGSQLKVYDLFPGRQRVMTPLHS